MQIKQIPSPQGSSTIGNLEFSKIGAAILRNKKLTSHIVQRIMKLTPAEEDAGFFEIPFLKGEERHVLKIAVGPQKKNKGPNPV